MCSFTGLLFLLALDVASAFSSVGVVNSVQLDASLSRHYFSGRALPLTSPHSLELSRFSISSRRSVNLGAANGVRGIVGLKVAISAGRGGTKGLALGVKIDEALRTADNKYSSMEGICLEAQLRKAALAKLECKLDDIYEDEPIDFTDQDSMAMHAASGMRVTSGCPMHLLHGVKGGCEACKCRVPTMREVKKYCPYYGGASSAAAPKSAWALQADLKDTLKQCGALVLLSGAEDISGNPEWPFAKEIVGYQKELVKEAKAQGVAFVLLVGPSDDIEGGAKSVTSKIKRDVSLQSGLNRAVRQLGGLEVAEDERREVPGMGKLLLEPFLESAGVGYSVVRAPLKLFATKQLAAVVLQALESQAPNKCLLVQDLPGFVNEDEQAFASRVAAERAARASAPLLSLHQQKLAKQAADRRNADKAPSVQDRKDFFMASEPPDLGEVTSAVDGSGSSAGDAGLNEPEGKWGEFD